MMFLMYIRQNNSWTRLTVILFFVQAETKRMGYFSRFSLVMQKLSFYKLAKIGMAMMTKNSKV